MLWAVLLEHVGTGPELETLLKCLEQKRLPSPDLASAPWCSLGEWGNGSLCSPYNGPHNPFPHSLLSTRESDKAE